MQSALFIARRTEYSESMAVRILLSVCASSQFSSHESSQINKCASKFAWLLSMLHPWKCINNERDALVSLHGYELDFYRNRRLL